MRKILLIVLMLAVISVSYAQRTITGTVTDGDDDSPLPGVSIVIKGTTNGTITDVDGNYKLTAQEGDVILFSFIGYQTYEETVGSKSVIDVRMDLDISQLDEVVVVGYGTQEREDVTGAITSVNAETLTQIPTASFEQALSGRMSGVQVTQSSGAAGGGATVRIRGTGTLNNAEPLYVIDGVILGNVGASYTDVSPLAMINPNDIESVDVLKDASATAIYGARAANGVVIITTKRGDKGGINVTFSAEFSRNVIDESKFDRLSGPDWASAYIRARQLSYGDTVTISGSEFLNRAANGDYKTYDWFDYAMDNGQLANYNVSLSGGNANSQYFASVNYSDNSATILNSDFERYAVRFNSEHKFGKFKFGNTLNVSRTQANVVGNSDPTSNTNNSISWLLYTNPYKPIFDDSVTADGIKTYAGLEDFQAMYGDEGGILVDHQNNHIIWRLENYMDYRQSTRIIGSVFTEYEIFDGLSVRTELQGDINDSRTENRNYALDVLGTSERTRDISSLQFGTSENRNIFWINNLNYQKTFGVHQLSVLLGHQMQDTRYRSFSASQSGFDSFYPTIWEFGREPLWINPATGVTNQPGVGSTEYPIKWLSYFGRVTYEYDSKYLFTGTVRRDGSSKFGADNQYGTFYSGSVGWRFTEETFFQGIPVISNGKLRMGFGVSGSDNTGGGGYNGLFNYQQSFNSGVDFDYPFDNAIYGGTSIDRPANPTLKWEESKMFNVGLDLGFFNNRLEATLDYFDKTTQDLFFRIDPPLEGGFTSQVNVNVGDIQNKGFELGIRSTNVVSPVVWTTDFNMAIIRNKVNVINGQDKIEILPNTVIPGQAIGVFYGYQTDGLFQSWEEVYAHARQQQATTGEDLDGDGFNDYDTDSRDYTRYTSPGDVRFVDINEDGIIDEDDRVQLGDPNPDFTWGMTNTVSYKGISLSVFLQGVHGNDIWNGFGRGRMRFPQGGSNGSYASLEDRWSAENPGAANPRIHIEDPNGNFRGSDLHVEDGSYVRVKNVRLGYQLPSNVMEVIGASRMNIYGSITNLATFTNYSGYDPEIGINNLNQPWRQGIDGGTLPLTRTFTIGATLTF